MLGVTLRWIGAPRLGSVYDSLWWVRVTVRVRERRQKGLQRFGKDPHLGPVTGRRDVPHPGKLVRARWSCGLETITRLWEV